MSNTKKTVRMSFWFMIIMLMSVIVVGCGNESEGDVQETATAENGSSQKAEEDGSSELDFPTNEIQFIVPVSAGGGFDSMSRMLSPYWEEYLGNDAVMVVENMPGGQYNIAVNELWQAEADGHKVGIFPGVIANQIFSDVDYDLREFEWIGQITESVFVQAASKESGFTSMDDVVEAGEVTTGIAGFTATAGIASLVAADSFGYEQEVISHEGSSEAILAAVRGDTDLVYQSYESLEQHFESGDLVPLWVGTSERIDELPDVPSVAELGDYPELVTLGTLPRFVGTTPDTPTEIVEILRETFENAVKDQGFQEEMSKNETPVIYLDGEGTADLVDNVLIEYENFEEIIAPYVD